MTTDYKVSLSHEDEALVEYVRNDAGIGNKEKFTKLALLMFSEIYMKKKDQLENEEQLRETNNSTHTPEDSQGTEEE